MAIDFPNSPTTGDTYTVNGRTWKWDGTTWAAYGNYPDPTVFKVDTTSGYVGINNISPTVALDVTGSAVFSGSITVDGDFTVSGTTTTINTTELNVEDNIITLNHGVTGTPSLDAGIEVERGDETNAQLLWDESAGAWVVNSDFTVDTDTLHVDATNDRVGIGTTSPTQILDIQNADNAEINLNDSGGTVGTNTSAKLQFQAGGADAGHVGFNNTSSGVMAITQENGPLWVNNKSASNILLRTDNTTRMTIDASGNVGIGTTTPLGTLDISGNTETLIFSSPSGTNRYRFDANMTDAADYGFSLSYWDGSAYQRSLTLLDNGNVGIGTTTPASDLHVADTEVTVVLQDTNGTVGGSMSSIIQFTDSTGAVQAQVGLGTGTGYFIVDNNDGPMRVGTVSADRLYLRTNNADRLTIDSSGNVGIGTIVPAVALDIHGGSRVQIDVSDDVYPKIGNYYSSSDNLEVGSYGGIHFVVDVNGNTSEVFEWRSGASSGAGALRMQLDASSTLTNYGTVEVRPPGASAVMMNCYPTGLSAGTRGMTIRGPSDSTSTPIQFETGNSFGFVTDGVTRLYISNSGISKSGGSFDIQHPLEPTDSTARLRHGFLEGPYNDNVYRGTAVLDSSGEASIDLDTHFGMREGTWLALNTNPWVMAAVNGGASVTWALDGKVLSLNGNAGDSVQWIVIGERHDPHVTSDKNTSTDENGRLILEYIREWGDEDSYNPPFLEDSEVG
jgi:hypothetical protein